MAAEAASPDEAPGLRRLAVWRTFSDGLAVEQRFELALDSRELRTELAIRPGPAFASALQALYPLAPPQPGTTNLVLSPWGEYQSVIDFGWTASEEVRWWALGDGSREASGAATPSGKEVVATGLAALGCDTQRNASASSTSIATSAMSQRARRRRSGGVSSCAGMRGRGVSCRATRAAARRRRRPHRTRAGLPGARRYRRIGSECRTRAPTRTRRRPWRCRRAW